VFVRFAQTEDEVGENSDEQCCTDHQGSNKGVCKSALTIETNRLFKLTKVASITSRNHGQPPLV
jgi:hypothetical protein